MPSPRFRYVLFDLDNTLADRALAVRHLAESLYDSDLIDKGSISLEDATSAFVERFPRVATVGDGLSIVVPYQVELSAADRDIQQSYSTDGGASWTWCSWPGTPPEGWWIPCQRRWRPSWIRTSSLRPADSGSWSR